MEKMKDFFGFVCLIPFVLFASFVISHCDCETSIFDDMPADALNPVDAEYKQI